MNLFNLKGVKAMKENEKVWCQNPHSKYVPIGDIYPNPLNPRRDYSQNAGDMERTLLEQGWKEPLTVYEFGKGWLLLSGHRRWFAAKKIHSENPKLMAEIPVFIVSKPENEMEAIRSLALHQSARKDWTVYEWAKMTYEVWKELKEPPYSEIAFLINKDKTLVGQYIDVFRSFPAEEVEAKLVTEEYYIGPLNALAAWLRRFEEHQKDLSNQLGISYVRRMMLKKYERHLINEAVLKGDKFVELATFDEMKEFLFNNTTTLKQCQASLGIEKVSDLYSSWKSDAQKMAYTAKIINEFPLSNRERVENFEIWLDKILSACKSKKKEITRFKEKS